MATEQTPHTLLAAHIREIVPITDADMELITKAFREKILAKKEFLLSEGDISNHMRFVVKGCLRSYYLNEVGQEYIVQFGIPGYWINDLYSYLTQKPAAYFLQAVSPATVLMIHRDQLTELYDQIPALERFFRIKFERAYVALMDRTLRNMSLTAKERYEHFRRQYRDIEQSVPQYMVASYLGITPEFLSALRSSG